LSPKESHKKAILRIRIYLIATKKEGLIIKPEGKSLELWREEISAEIGDRRMHMKTEQLLNLEKVM